MVLDGSAFFLTEKMHKILGNYKIQFNFIGILTVKVYKVDLRCLWWTFLRYFVLSYNLDIYAVDKILNLFFNYYIQNLWVSLKAVAFFSFLHLLG